MNGSGYGLRVLVVDDERNIADSLAMILRMQGHTVHAVYNAEEAILVAEDFQPQAVISDVVMPGMNGVDLAVHLADRHPECKVLLISGSNAAGGLVQDSVREGHSHTILPKPMHPAKILEFLESCGPAI